MILLWWPTAVAGRLLQSALNVITVEKASMHNDTFPPLSIKLYAKLHFLLITAELMFKNDRCLVFVSSFVESE